MSPPTDPGVEPDVDEELDDLVLPPVEVWAREPAPEQLRTVEERFSEKTGKALKPKVVNTPAVLLGDRAEAAGWVVEYRYARGPLVKRTRPDEPNEHGKYALVTTIPVVDTSGLRAQHPDGRRIVAWWVDGGFSEGWGASPRRNARALGIRALTAYLTDEEVLPVTEQEKDEPKRSRVSEDATERLAEIEATTGYNVDEVRPCDAWVDGYRNGHAAASEKAGEAYGEGFAAGVAEVAGRGRAWVTTRKRLDALDRGDVILGKGGRWWIVSSVGGRGGQTAVVATSGDEETTVVGASSRKTDIVVEVDVAAALDVLKDGLDAKPPRADGVAA